MAENLTIAGLESFAPGAGVREKLEHAVACDYRTLLDIREEDLKRPIETLSHRCQLNVALYKWIIAKARLIVIDNLFSGTDILMRNSVREFLEFAKSRGIGVVYCSPNERGPIRRATARGRKRKGYVQCDSHHAWNDGAVSYTHLDVYKRQQLCDA